MNPKRCSACGQVTVCEYTVCPSCHQPRLRPLSAEERAAWERHSELEPDLRAQAVAVQCGMTGG
jgi:hypothetical protein